MIRTKFALLLTFIGALPLAAQNVRQEKDTVSYMNDDLEMWLIPYFSTIRSLCVPFPEPGAPKITMFSILLIYNSTFYHYWYTYYLFYVSL
jgi:hypothetical protein